MLHFKESSILVKSDLIIDLPYEKINHFIYHSGYIEIYPTEGKKILARTSVNNLYKSLPDCFIRISRAVILNFQNCHAFIKKNDKGYFIMKNDIQLRISRRLVAQAKERWIIYNNVNPNFVQTNHDVKY